MQIHIRYRRRDEGTARLLQLSPEDYFDAWQDGDELSVRSVAKHSEAFEYVGCRAEDLLWTVLEITDGTEFWRVRTQLLDGLRSLMHHSRESDGSEEIIHHTEIGPQSWHTIRTLREPGKMWTVVMNNLTVEQPETPLKSRNFCGQLSFEQLKAFGGIE